MALGTYWDLSRYLSASSFAGEKAHGLLGYCFRARHGRFRLLGRPLFRSCEPRRNRRRHCSVHARLRRGSLQHSEESELRRKPRPAQILNPGLHDRPGLIARLHGRCRRDISFHIRDKRVSSLTWRRCASLELVIMFQVVSMSSRALPASFNWRPTLAHEVERCKLSP
jgi:hypothetical protein